MDRVREDFIRSPKKSISRVSAELQMPQATAHRVLWKGLCLKPYKLQVVQKLTARDKQPSLQSAAHMSAQILEHDNFLVEFSSLMIQNFASLDVPIGIAVSFGTVSIRKNI
jgi:hypothetical protein